MGGIDLAPALDALVATLAPWIAGTVAGWLIWFLRRVFGVQIEARDRAAFEAAVARAVEWGADAAARGVPTLRTTTGRPDVDLALDYLAQGMPDVIRRLGGRIDGLDASEPVIRRVEVEAARRKRG